MKLAFKTRSPMKHPFRTFYRKRENDSVGDPDDPHLGEMIRNGSIPNRLSLRAPPTRLGHASSTESLIGITNQDVSRRYIVKLHQERERHNETVNRCMDNLPIKIKKMVEESNNPMVRKSFHKSDDHGLFRSDRWQDKVNSAVFTSDNFERISNEAHIKHTLCSKCNRKPKWRKHRRQDKRLNYDNKHIQSGATTATTTTEYSDLTTPDVASYTSGDDVYTAPSTDVPFTHSVGFSGCSIRTKVSRPAKNKKSQIILKNINGRGMKNRKKNVFDLDKDLYLVHPPVVTGRQVKHLNQLPPLNNRRDLFSQGHSPELSAITSVQLMNRPLGYNTSPLLPVAPYQSLISESTEYQQRFSANIASEHSREWNYSEDEDVLLPDVLNGTTTEMTSESNNNVLIENENKNDWKDSDNADVLPLSIDALHIHTANNGEINSSQEKRDLNICNLTDIIEREESNLTRTTRTMQSDNEPEVKISVRIAYKTADENIIKEKSTLSENDDSSVHRQSQQETYRNSDKDSERASVPKLNLERDSSNEEESDDSDDYDDYGDLYKDALRTVAESITDTHKAMRKIDKSLMYRKLHPFVVEVGKEIPDS